MATPKTEEKDRQALANEYLTSFAFCNLASFDFFPQDGYASLKDTMLSKRSELEAAISSIYVPPGPLPLPKRLIESAKRRIDNRFVNSKLIADEIEKAVADSEDWKVKAIQSEHSKALVFTKGDEAKIFFCPTPPMSLGVWLKDFDVVKATKFTTGTGVECKMHAGFIDVFNEVKDKLRTELSDENGKLKYKQIDLAGYSLGAALSDVFTSSLNAQERNHVRTVTTFGDPQAGDKKFAEDLDSTMPGRITNLVDRGDIFAHISKARFPGFLRPGHDVDVGAPFNNRFNVMEGLVRHLPLAYITAIDAWGKVVQLAPEVQTDPNISVLDSIKVPGTQGWAR